MNKFGGLLDLYYCLTGDGVTHKLTEEEQFCLAFTENRKIADTYVCGLFLKEIHISTVFLGMDHSYDDVTPLLFETMVFGGALDQELWRYETLDEANIGHNKAVDAVFQALPLWRKLIYCFGFLVYRKDLSITEIPHYTKNSKCFHVSRGQKYCAKCGLSVDSWRVVNESSKT